MKNKAFTLAEVLISMTIIGIVAVITISSFASSILLKVRHNQTIAAKHKFAKAIEQMALHNDIGPYYGIGKEKINATEEFAQKLAEYYKVNKICPIERLDECWGYKEIKMPNGDIYDITQAINGKLFKSGGSESLGDDYDVYTQGLMGLDGTRFIIAFNKNCKVVEPQIYTWSKDATTNSAMDCISGILDIDGKKAPNTVGWDISFINASGIGKNCIVELGDACFGALFKPEPITINTEEECTKIKALGMKFCYKGKKDNYAGAIKACGGKENLPSEADFEEFKREAYFNGIYFSGGTYKKGTATKYGLMEPVDGENSQIFVWIKDDETQENSGTAFSYSLGGATVTPIMRQSNIVPYAICKIK